ncbi:Uncharacterised protein [uncultured archaeon]|nr:Uncharacterised protein [uncultured archaeon]
MRKGIIIALVFLLLAPSYLAAPLQLSGNAGRSLLGSIDQNNSLNESFNSSNQTDLWNWGKMPVGHSLNSSSGKMGLTPDKDEAEVEVAPQHSRA